MAACGLTDMAHFRVASTDGERRYRCSNCGRVGAWGKGWVWYGVEECRYCQNRHVDEVFCPTCGAKNPTPKGK